MSRRHATTPKYRGAPCGRCGGMLRYQSTRACIRCARTVALEAYREQREIERLERTTEMDMPTVLKVHSA